MVTPTASLIELALAHHQAGRLEQAEVLYRQLLDREPRHADLHYLLGLIATQRRQVDVAVDHLQMAVACNPTKAPLQSALAAGLATAGRAAEAIEHYREAVRLEPQLAEAHHNLGLLLQDRRQFDEALTSFRLAAQLRPESAEIHLGLGNCCKIAGKPAEALAAYRQALQLKPDMAAAHHQMGIVLQGARDFIAAAEAHRRAFQLNPDSVEALAALGVALQWLGEADEAKDCFERSLRMRPDDPAIQYAMATVLHGQGDLRQAERYYHSVLEQVNDHVEALASLGAIHLARGESAAAEGIRDRLLQINPDDPSAHLLQATMLLGAGELTAGWQALDRYFQSSVDQRRFSQALWNGEELGSRTLLVHADDGLGDTLQFIRYVPLIQAGNPRARVIVEVQPTLIPLLRQSGFHDLVAKGTPSQDVDVQVRLMSLPGVFRSTLETIPAEIPYLATDSQLIQRWQARLANVGGFKVGINWQGSKAYKGDQHRSIALSHFEPLAKVPGVTLVSLQTGLGSEQLSQGSSQFHVVTLDGLDARGGAFMDTAAVIKNLDLVITSDSAVAHLAGALGAPVWLALSTAAEWRWLKDRDDSLWYPTMRLFRQSTLDDWPELFHRLAKALSELVSADG